MSSRRETFFSSFNRFPYFTKEMLYAAARRFNMPQSTLNSYIYKGLRNTQIISLKRNYYVTRSFYDAHKTDTTYFFSLANTLLKPSYVSLEAALQYYGLFAEAVNYTITSVTLKLPRTFQNRMGTYSYRKINEKLFTDFQGIKGNFEFTIALPHKAIFDYIYYHTNCFTKNIHVNLLEELRIDTDSLPLEEKENLAALLSGFTSIKMHI